MPPFEETYAKIDEQKKEEARWDGWNEATRRFVPYHERVTGLDRKYPRMLYRAGELSSGKTVCGADEYLMPGGEMEPLKTTHIVFTPEEADRYLSNGWHPGPQEAIAARMAQHLNVAKQAAVRAHSDRSMSERAQAEIAAENAAAGIEHVLDPPAPKKRPGRKPKAVEPA